MSEIQIDQAVKLYPICGEDVTNIMRFQKFILIIN